MVSVCRPFRRFQSGGAHIAITAWNIRLELTKKKLAVPSIQQDALNFILLKIKE